jgi:SAM-dependent methyltransferase
MAYSERLLEQGNFLTRLAHGGRYKRTLELAEDIRGAVAIDFGCGDGMLLRRAYDRGIVRGGYGIDTDPEMRRSAAARFAGIEGFQFIHPAELAAVVAPGSCDLGLCTETLEHVPSSLEVLDALVASCRPGGHVLVTVPIEVGPALLGKQIGRYLAGLRRPYGYETYRLNELVWAALLWNPQAFESSHLEDHLHEGIEFRGHKGFDYRRIEAALRARTEVEQTRYSPFPLAGPMLNSTVMWRCRVRNRPASS